MRTALRKIGNSSGMIVPKAILAEAGVMVGATLDLTVENGRIVAAPVAAGPRAGWAESARALAEADDDALVYPEFANDGDEQLTW